MASYVAGEEMRCEMTYGALRREFPGVGYIVAGELDWAGVEEGEELAGEGEFAHCVRWWRKSGGFDRWFTADGGLSEGKTFALIFVEVERWDEALLTSFEMDGE